MKALQVTDFGDQQVLQIRDIPVPVPSDDQVLVRVAAASINPFDVKLRSGVMKGMITLPYTFGGDFSGTIEQLGKNITEFAKGDKVYGTAIALGAGSGAFGELAVVKAGKFAKMPTTIDFPQAASLPLTGTSAVQAIQTHMHLTAGTSILIHGGAGGIGSLAVQLAKSLGATVYATASGDDGEFVQSLGASKVLDYRSQKFEEELKNLDFVFDTVGGAVTQKSVNVLKPGGMLVSMIGDLDEAMVKEKGITYIRQQSQNSAVLMDMLRVLVENGSIKPVVGAVYPLDHYQQAFEEFEHKHPRGKVVITLES